MCAFHLRVDHDGDACADMFRNRQMVDNKEQTIKYPKSEDDHAPCGDSENYLLEHESGSKASSDYFATLEGPQLKIMTRGQKNRNQTNNLVPTKNNAPSNKANKDSGIVTSTSQKEHKDKSTNPLTSYNTVKR